MKKGVILIVFVFFSIQSLPQSQISLKGGVMVSKFFEQSDSKPSQYSSLSPPYFISFTFRENITKIFRMSGELEYNHRTFHTISVSFHSFGNTTDTLDIDFDQVRINLQPQFIFGKKLKFYFYPGVYLGYRIHSRVWGVSVYDGHFYHKSYDIDQPTYGYPPQWEFGGVLGLGIEVPLSHGFSFSLENTETMNIVKMYPSWGMVSSFHIIDFRFNVGVSYTFSSKKKDVSVK